MGSSAPPLLSVSCTHLGQKRGALGGSGSLVGPGGVPWVAANLASEKRLSLGPSLGSLLTASPGLPPMWQQRRELGGGCPALAPRAQEQAEGPLTRVPSPAGCERPLRAPGGNTSPRPGNPSTWGSLSSPTGASPARPPPASQVTAVKGCEGLRGPRAWPPPTLCKRDPRGGTGRRPRALSPPPSVLCLRAASSSFRSSDKPIRTPSRSMRECPLPWHTTLPSFWKVLSHSPSPVEVGAHCGQSSQPLMSREGAGHRAACPHPPGPRPPHAQEELL